MAGAFQRLIGRATGAEMAGLRPRLPALFESSGDQAGFDERQQEASVPASSRPELRRSVPPPAPAAAPRSIADPERRAAASDVQAQAPIEAQSSGLAPSRSLNATQPPDASSPAIPAPLLRTEVTSAPTSPAGPETTGETPSHAAPLPEMRQEPASHPNRQIAQGELPDPPRPLLQELTPDRAAKENRHIAQAPAASPRPDPRDEAVQPEITIHIGQLDVRSATPQPVAPQRSAPRARNLPSLSDYLRGRGS